jgi:hypothetical protein
VYENKPPKAVLALGAGGTARRKRRSVVLDAGLSTDPEGETLRFVWRFSDKSRRTGPTVKKSFSSDGRYTVRLQVSDPLGANTLLKRTLIVNGPRGIRMRAP